MIRLRTLILLCLGWTSCILAGTGPETTLLVVNADSPLSLTVANRWMALRDIPGSHVVWLHDIPTLGTLSMADFRNRILQPIHDFMSRQDLDEAIDTIVYSADFPYAVSLGKELRHLGIKQTIYIGTAGSLTGLTFFSNQVLAGKGNYVSPMANQYFRREYGSAGRLPNKPLSKKDAQKEKQARKALKKGKYAQARALIEELLQKHGSDRKLRLLFAEILAALGQTNAALHQLERLQQLGWNNSLALRNDKWLASLKSTPEFKRIMRKIDDHHVRFEPPRGFHSRYHWSRAFLTNGTSRLDQYYLSAALAYTGPRGNSLPEIERYLSRSVRSDGHHPRGTVYLMENRDVRTETRQAWFGETCALLKAIGHRCEILEQGKNGENGILPKKRKDIIGLVAGTRTFDPKRSGSQLLPGAIAESLTSYGGDFANSSQTKLTAFLRWGASGSSGAVVEPYSIPEKFPLPLMHYYYALGYSLAESWFQAVASPYQNILVGDPLTTPFSDPVSISLKKPALDKPWHGKVSLVVEHGVRTARKHALDHYELWIDGKPITEGKLDAPLTWDTTQYADGYHQMRLVAVEKTPREGRSSRVFPVWVSNHGLAVTIESSAMKTAYSTPFLLSGTAPAGSRISIRQGSRELLSLHNENERWDAILSSRLLGLGQVKIQAVATTPSGLEVHSRPLALEITKDFPWKPAPPHGRWKQGLDLILIQSDEAGHLHTEVRTVKNLNGKVCTPTSKKLKLERATVSGQFRTKKSGFYQLSIRTRGKIRIEVDGHSFEKKVSTKKYGMTYLPMFLRKGWHHLEIQPDPSGCENLWVLLAGEEPPVVVGGKLVRSSRTTMTRKAP